MRRFLASFALLLVGVSLLAAQHIEPAGGSLVIVGGAMKDEAIVKKFIELAGGPDAAIIIIPTAGGAQSYGQDWDGLKQFRDAGARNLLVLHTYDRAEADKEAFAAPIRTARGVWFGGGRQWRLADSYLNTRVHTELKALLARGGVIGGSSAGATIIGSYLARGDTRDNETMMGDHEVGLGFFAGTAIDQHLLRRNRQFDLLPVIKAHPDLLGIGLDENTAIIVRGDEFEVMGASYAVLFDPTRRIDTGGDFAFLGAGDKYNFKTHTATRPGTNASPLSRYQPRSPEP